MTSYRMRADGDEIRRARELHERPLARWRGVHWERWLLEAEPLAAILADGGLLGEARALADDIAEQAKIYAGESHDWRCALARIHESIAWSLSLDYFPRGAILEYLDALEQQPFLPEQLRSVDFVAEMMTHELKQVNDRPLERAVAKIALNLELGETVSPEDRASFDGPGELSARERKQLAKIRAVGELRGAWSPLGAMLEGRLVRLEAELAVDLREAPLREEALKLAFGSDGSVPFLGYAVSLLGGEVKIVRLRRT